MGISLPISCIVFLSIIFVLVLPLDFTCGVAKFDIGFAISCMLDVSGNGGFFLNLHKRFTNQSFYLHLNPALPYPNLGFIL